MLTRWFVNWPLAWARIFTPTAIELVIIYGFILLWLTAPLAGTGVLRAIQRSRPLTPPRPNAKHHVSIEQWWSICTAVLLTALVVDAGWWSYQRFFSSKLRVTFLSVGQGDAAVVHFPGARVMLIDGGGGFRSFDPGERVVARYLWSHKIMHLDYIALSHPDRDHFGGLIFVIRNFTPSQFWSTGADSEDSSYDDLLNAVKDSGAHQFRCDSAAKPNDNCRRQRALRRPTARRAAIKAQQLFDDFAARIRA
jgi:beta-lactamase superfamily II metal-dependent hydrolase